MKADKRSNWYETHRTCPSIISNAQKCAWNYANQMLYWFVVSCECSTTALCLCMRVFVNFTISIDWPFIKSTHTKTENRRLNYVNYIKFWIFQTKIKMFKVPKVMFSFPNAQKKMKQKSVNRRHLAVNTDFIQVSGFASKRHQQKHQPHRKNWTRS